jgi:hypothetical protein
MGSAQFTAKETTNAQARGRNKAPAFSWPDQDGKKVALKDFKGAARSSRRFRLSDTGPAYRRLGAFARTWRIVRVTRNALIGNSELVPPGRIRMTVCPEGRVSVTWRGRTDWRAGWRRC